MECIKELSKRTFGTSFKELKSSIEWTFKSLSFTQDRKGEIEILSLKDDYYIEKQLIEFWLLVTPFFKDFKDVPWRTVGKHRFVADPKRLEQAKRWWLEQLQASGIKQANEVAEKLELDTYPHNVWDVAEAHEVYTSSPISVAQWDKASSPEEVEALFKGKGCKASYLANVFFKSNNLPYEARYISGGGGFSNPRNQNYDPNWGGKKSSPHFKDEFWICQWAESGNAWVGNSGGGILIAKTTPA